VDGGVHLESPVKRNPEESSQNQEQNKHAADETAMPVSESTVHTLKLALDLVQRRRTDTPPTNSAMGVTVDTQRLWNATRVKICETSRWQRVHVLAVVVSAGINH